jgi:hypothetical protein
VRLEEEAKAAQEIHAHIQEDFAHKPQVDSRTTSHKLLTPFGSLLEQLKRMRRN